jgi:hypothetical protein
VAAGIWLSKGRYREAPPALGETASLSLKKVDNWSLADSLVGLCGLACEMQ